MCFKVYYLSVYVYTFFVFIVFLYRNGNQIIEMSVISQKKSQETNVYDWWMGEKFLVFFFLEQFDKKHMMPRKLVSHMLNTFYIFFSTLMDVLEIVSS